VPQFDTVKDVDKALVCSLSRYEHGPLQTKRLRRVIDWQSSMVDGCVFLTLRQNLPESVYNGSVRATNSAPGYENRAQPAVECPRRI
jgi:hypothetical protein